jgi:HAMP domain-containing protein
MHNRRRQIVVYKKIQYKYAVLTVTLLVLYTMMLLAAIFGPSIALFMSKDIPLAARAEAASAFLLLNRLIWPGIVAIILLFGVFSLFVTRKLAGSLFVFERTVNQMASGQLSARMKLRKHYDLTELEQSMNRLADKLETSLSALHDHGKNLVKLAHTHSPEHAFDNHAKVLVEVEAIEKILAQYTFSEKRKTTG